MFLRLPDEPTTPQQWQVIAWATILLFFIAGSLGFYFSFGASPDKHHLAQQVRYYSLGFYGLSAAVYALKRMVGFFIE